jgi:tetrahydromethanopterin S-methyltransferase subunit G
MAVDEFVDYLEPEISERMEEKIGASFRAGIIVGAIIATIAIIAGYNF